MKNTIKISTVNFHPEWGDKETNLNKILGFIEKAASEGSNLIVLPEMALTGYDDDADNAPESKMQTLNAETVPGASSEAVAELTKKYGMYAVFGMPEKDGDKIYNSACVCGPDGIIGTYRKIHLPFPEMNWATRGEKPFIFDTEWGPIGVSICYDTYCFPELNRYFGAKGCRIHINSSAYARCHGEFIAKASVETNAATSSSYIVNSNLVGLDVVNDFWGGASIIGPCERIFDREYYAGYPFTDPRGIEEAMYTAEVDLSLAGLTMYGPNPLMDDMPDFRPAVYKEMMEDLLKDPKYQN